MTSSRVTHNSNHTQQIRSIMQQPSSLPSPTSSSPSTTSSLTKPKTKRAKQKVDSSSTSAKANAKKNKNEVIIKHRVALEKKIFTLQTTLIDSTNVSFEVMKEVVC